MTTQQQLLEQAKQGEPRAIALLIANSLEAQGIAVKTNLKGDCLRVMLESSQVPNQSTMVAFIRRGMIKLGAASIKTVKVYGKLAEASTLAWSQDIDLEDAIAVECPSSNSLPQIASSGHKSTLPTNKSPSSQPVDAFKSSFLSAYLLFLILIPFSALIWLVLIAIGMEIKSHFLTTIALINVIETILIFNYCIVYISPKGIKSYDLWLRYHFVEWSSITAVTRFNLLGLEYLLVSSTQSSETLWVPLFLPDLNQFGKLVSKYTGKEHMFTQCLFGKSSHSPTLGEINGQIKAGWLPALILGGTNLCLGIFGDIDIFIRLGCILDATFILILAYKIKNKSRVAALIMLTFYFFSKLFFFLGRIGALGVDTTNYLGRFTILELPFFLIISIVFTGCFVEGVRGTFTYHSLVELQNLSSSQT